MPNSNPCWSVEKETNITKHPRTVKNCLNGEKQQRRGRSWWSSQRAVRPYHWCPSFEAPRATLPGSGDCKWGYMSRPNRRCGRRQGCCICNSPELHGHLWCFYIKHPHTATSQFVFIFLILLLGFVPMSPLASLCGADVCVGWYQADPGCVQKRSSCTASALGLHGRAANGSPVPYTGIWWQRRSGWCTGRRTPFDRSAHTHYSRYSYEDVIIHVHVTKHWRDNFLLSSTYTSTASLWFQDTVFMMHKVTLFPASWPLCPCPFPAFFNWCTWISPSIGSPVCLPAFSACQNCRPCSSAKTGSQNCLLISASCPPSPTSPLWGTNWPLFPRVWVNWRGCTRWMFPLTFCNNYLMKLVLWRALLSWNCPRTNWGSYQRAWVSTRVWMKSWKNKLTLSFLCLFKSPMQH